MILMSSKQRGKREKKWIEKRDLQCTELWKNQLGKGTRKAYGTATVEYYFTNRQATHDMWIHNNEVVMMMAAAIIQHTHTHTVMVRKLLHSLDWHYFLLR